MSTFQPNLFIGIGQDQHYFTLRETYEHHYKGAGGEPRVDIRSMHHFNLSQDAEEAYEKAKKASEHMGLELRANFETLAQEMLAIQRATAEEVERRAEAYRVQQTQWEQDRKDRDAFRFELVSAGFWPFKFHINVEDMQMVGGVMGILRMRKMFNERNKQEVGKREPWDERDVPQRDAYLNSNFKYLEVIREKDVGLLTWWARHPGMDSELAKAVQQYILDECEDLLLPEPIEGYYGEEGERIEFHATVVRCFHFDGYYGRTYVTVMVEEQTRKRLVVMSGAFVAKLGDVIHAKATIKKHETYKGETQTMLQRVKEIGK